MEKCNKPDHEIRLGKIRATIWLNRRENEEAWYRVTMSRLFKDGDTWRNTQSFRPDDLPVLGKVLDMAHDWLLGRMPESSFGPLEVSEANESGNNKKKGKTSHGRKSKKDGSDRSGDDENTVRKSRSGRDDQSVGSKRGRSASSSRKNSPRA